MDTKVVSAARELARSRGLELEDVLEAIEDALAEACAPLLDVEDAQVRIDTRTGHATIQGRLADGQVRRRDLSELDAGLREAANLRRVFERAVADLDAQAALDRFGGRPGGLVRGKIIAYNRSRFLVDLKGIVAELPKDELLETDVLRKGMQVSAVVQKVAPSSFDGVPRVIISRSDPRMAAALLAEDAPLFEDELVETVHCARVVGVRSVVAIAATDDRISTSEAVRELGSGANLRKIERALTPFARREKGEPPAPVAERVKVIGWDDDREVMIRRLLSPLRGLSIAMEEDQVVVAASKSVLAELRDEADGRVQTAQQMLGVDITLEESGSAETNARVRPVDEKILTGRCAWVSERGKPCVNQATADGHCSLHRL